MLIHPWDRGGEGEWRAWIAEHDFGLLAANGPEDAAPVLVPTHFLHRVGGADGTPATGSGSAVDEILLHLARPNPIWAAVAANPRVVLAVTDDHAFVPGPWRTAAEEPSVATAPTSYYASVHLVCTAAVVDDPAEKAALLGLQLAHFQPEFPNPPIVPGQAPFGRMLSGIRGLRLRVEEVRPKFKYDDKKPVELQTDVADRLTLRDRPGDAAARTQLLRRRDSRIDPDAISGRVL